MALDYAEEEVIKAVIGDDPVIEYTDDDTSVDFSTYNAIDFIIAKDSDNLYSNPDVTVSKSSMTINGNVVSFTLPDSLSVGLYFFRYRFTDSGGNDMTPKYGKIVIF